MKPASDICARVDELLLDYAYGELDAPGRAEVDRHLPGCADCANALAELTGTRKAMSALAPEPAPEAGLESLLAYAESAAARTREAAKRPARPWWHFVLPAAPLAAAMALVLVVATRQSASPEAVLRPAVTAASAPAEAAERTTLDAKDEGAKLVQGAATGGEAQAAVDATALAREAPADARERVADKQAEAKPADGFVTAEKAQKEAKYQAKPKAEPVAAMAGKKRAELDEGSGGDAPPPAKSKAARAPGKSAGASFGFEDDSLAGALSGPTGGARDNTTGLGAVGTSSGGAGAGRSSNAGRAEEPARGAAVPAEPPPPPPAQELAQATPSRTEAEQRAQLEQQLQRTRAEKAPASKKDAADRDDAKVAKSEVASAAPAPTSTPPATAAPAPAEAPWLAERKVAPRVAADEAEESVTAAEVSSGSTRERRGDVPANPLAAARALAQRGDHAGAVTLLEKALRASAMSPGERAAAMALRAEEQARLGDTEAALTSCQSYLYAYPEGAAAARITWLKAELLDQLGRAYDAEDAWTEAARRNPDRAAEASSRAQRLRVKTRSLQPARPASAPSLDAAH